jgi:hypothetical protein
MRTFLISAFLLIVNCSFAQQDYFYAETLIDNGQHAEAVRVLDHLIDSGAYVDRPRFEMMTLNLAGNTKLYLKDSAGAKNCFESVLACYDTLRDPLKADDWNQREHYHACENLARLHYYRQEFVHAKELLIMVGPPQGYYSATGSDVLTAQDSYFSFFAMVYEKLCQPDSALTCMRNIRDAEYRSVRKLDSIFDVTTNNMGSVKCVPFSMNSSDSKMVSPGYLFFAAWHDAENTQHSIWFVHPESGPIAIIGESTHTMNDANNFPANCYDMSLSPDEKYLAVTCYTEGSNNIDIYSFPEILSEHTCIEKQSIGAYPSAVEIKGWEDNQLIVESDADLTRYNRKVRTGWDVTENPDDKALFLYDLESGKFSKK